MEGAQWSLRSFLKPRLHFFVSSERLSWTTVDFLRPIYVCWALLQVDLKCNKAESEETQKERRMSALNGSTLPGYVLPLLRHCAIQYTFSIAEANNLYYTFCLGVPLLLPQLEGQRKWLLDLSKWRLRFQTTSAWRRGISSRQRWMRCILKARLFLAKKCCIGYVFEVS